MINRRKHLALLLCASILLAVLTVFAGCSDRIVITPRPYDSTEETETSAEASTKRFPSWLPEDYTMPDWGDITYPDLGDVTYPDYEDYTYPDFEDFTYPDFEDYTYPDFEDYTYPDFEDYTYPDFEDITEPYIEDVTEPYIEDVTYPDGYWEDTVAPETEAITEAETSVFTSTSSEGLTFRLNKDGKSYTCTGVGSCEDAVVVVDTYQGLPVTAIGSMAFHGYTRMTSLILGNRITSIGRSAFSNCSQLTEVSLPDSLISLELNAFSYCVKLKTVSISASVTSIKDKAFWGCSVLTEITVAPENPAFCSIDGNLYSADGTTLIQYATGKSAISFNVPQGVTAIGNYAFSFCTKLESITLPDSLTAIGDFAFQDCSALYYMVIPHGVETVRTSAFMRCINLNYIVIPTSVTLIESAAFVSCTGLTHVLYMGSEAAWKAITVEDYNDYLKSATVFFTQTP